MGLGRKPPHVARRADDLGGQSMGPISKISVRLVAQTSTSSSMRSFSSAIFRSSVRTLSARSPKPADGAREPWHPAAVCHARCARLGGSRAFRILRRARGPIGAHAGCFERPSTLGHQVLASFGKQAQHLRAGLGIDRC